MTLEAMSDIVVLLQIVKHPIDMKTIKNKISKNVYSSINKLKNDFLLMFNNAKEFHPRDSQVYIDALILKGVRHFCYLHKATFIVYTTQLERQANRDPSRFRSWPGSRLSCGLS